MYLIVKNYTTDKKQRPEGCKPSGRYRLLLCLDDALDRADRSALGGVVVTDTLHAGGLVDDVEDAVTFADGFGWAFGHAGATGDAIFENFH